LKARRKSSRNRYNDLMRGRPNFYKLLLNALHCRCPNCRQGRVFRGWPNRVLPRCPHCGLSYFRESGYYLGGMIITYILTAFIVLGIYVASLALPGAGSFSENLAFAFWACLAISLTLLLMRPAYSLWLSLDFWMDPWQPDEPK
jgi:uncharacterized protein (DUF983 family)